MGSLVEGELQDINGFGRKNYEGRVPAIGHCWYILIIINYYWLYIMCVKFNFYG